MPSEAATALAAEEPAAAAPAEEPEPELLIGLAAVEEIEVLLHICSFLDPSSLGRLACVSSSFGRKVEWSSTRCRTNGDVQRLSDQPGDELWSLVDEAAHRRLHRELGRPESYRGSGSHVTLALTEVYAALRPARVLAGASNSSWLWLLAQTCISSELVQSWSEDRATFCAAFPPPVRAAFIDMPVGSSLVDFGTDRTLCIGDDGAHAVGVALQAMYTPGILEINLVSNDLSPVGLLPICVGIRRTCQHLQVLDLRGNARLGDAGVALLAGVLPATLVELDIYTTGCRDAGMSAIAAALAPLVLLQRLYCGGNSVGTLGWTALAAATPAARSLKLVDAAFSDLMGCGGAGAWAKMLSQCHALESLQLGRCGIGAVGAQALAVSFAERASSQSSVELLPPLSVQLTDNDLTRTDKDALEAACSEETNVSVEL